MRISQRIWTAVALALFALTSLSCGGGGADQAVADSLTHKGIEPESAVELSTLDLSDDEIEQLGVAKRGGVEGTALVEIVKAVHDDDLEFDLGMEVQTLSGAGFSATALVKLIEMGAARPWESDLRVMKHAGIGEPTILMIAERKFFDGKKDVLSGRDYERLKLSGISDAGIETFVESEGNVKELQQLEQMLRKGTPEQAALRTIGM